MAGLENIVQNWEYILLLFLRVSALIFSSPIFGRRNIPNTAKVWLCMALAYAFFGLVPQTEPIAYNDDLFFLVLLCVKELLFGLALGYVLNLFFTLVFTAGHVIDMEMGFGMVNVFDVQSNLSVPVSGNLLNIVLLICVLAMNGHIYLVNILYQTIVAVPVGTATFSAAIATTALELFVKAFLLAMYVAMPFVGSGLLSELTLGMLIKAMPQMNAFSIGMPLKVVIGFIMMIIVMPVYVNFTETIFESMMEGVDNMFAALAG